MNTNSNDNNLIMHLPCDKHNDYNFGEFGMPTFLTTDDVGMKLIRKEDFFNTPSWARFFMMLRRTVQSDRRLFFVDGIARMACINWFRDHVHEMKAFKHWEYDLKSYLDFIIENQNEEGFFYEITVIDGNGHTRMTDENCIKRFNDNVTLVRLEIEADVEYLVVEAATQVYKVTGDDEWIKSVLPRLEKAIDYMTSAPKRWDAEHGLVKRAFTMDTWDFAYEGNSMYNRRIEPHTPMSIMHGDNSGVYQAMNQLAWLNRKFGYEEKALKWETRAKKLRDNLNKYCWNGKFYTHQVHLGHSGAEDADETKILSLSNPYDINRKVTDIKQAQSIISEYKLRKEEYPAFAEWYCINPPYTKFKDTKDVCKPVDDYINGGIASFVAGELAKASFENGEEKYAWDILNRVRDLVFETGGEPFFLYHPKTRENLAGGPSGWGAAAIIDAIEVGLAGITDEDVCFNVLGFSPRWAITDIEEIRYITGYELSKKVVETRYWNTGSKLVFELLCPSKMVNCHILLPEGKDCRKVLLNGQKVNYEIVKVANSNYIDFTFSKNAITSSDKWIPLEKQTIEVFYE